MQISRSRLFPIFLLTLLLLNLVQAATTQLIFDESYYWHYAQEMAWGYFDHPPMVALMIKMGSAILPGELGVRLIGCLLFAGTTVLLWKMIEHPEKEKYTPHFFLLILAMPLVHAYGFFTLPDTPLLFFTAFLLWAYKQFLKQPSVGISILLGILMAAMMYSKYQAALVILLVFFSNPRLALNRYAWIALITGIACYLPHLIWLYENDWLTIRYHITERPNRAYELFDFTLGYFLNLILIFGLIFPVCYYALFRQKGGNLFRRALLFIVFGVLAFFFFSSFNRRIQTQWILIVCIPAIPLIFKFIIGHEGARKWLFRLGLASLVILLYARLGLVFKPLLPITYETHANKEWAQSVKDVAEERPVVFENSYRFASMYGFYAQKDTYSLNEMIYRKNQYSLDGSEEKVRGKEVLYITFSKDIGEYAFSRGGITPHRGYIIPNFRSYRKLECITDVPVSLGKRTTTLKIYNPYPFNIDLKELEYGVAFMNAYKQVIETHPAVVEFPEKSPTMLRSQDTLSGTLHIPVPREPDHVYFRAGISENELFWGLNGKPTRLSDE